MAEINALSKKKNITVSKFIRVASPSMGTSLLADRLDHSLNTILNFIGISTGIAANPVYAGVKSLLAEVAATKSKLSNGLEHLNLLVTAARISKQPKAKILIKALEKLNELLNKENV